MQTKSVLSHTNSSIQLTLWDHLHLGHLLVPPLAKLPKADMRQPLISLPSSKKIPTLSIFCQSGIYRKSVSWSLSFVFLRSHAWESLFYILWFYLRLRFSHCLSSVVPWFWWSSSWPLSLSLHYSQGTRVLHSHPLQHLSWDSARVAAVPSPIHASVKVCLLPSQRQAGEAEQVQIIDPSWHTHFLELRIPLLTP